MVNIKINDVKMLALASDYAKQNSTCMKVTVGSVIVPKNHFGIVYGCNRGIHDCVHNGCRRIQLYGENSKAHRLPSDCDAIHSEVDAITQAARSGILLEGATIWVTRYPCEACARAIANSGITRVVYGRKEEISDYTAAILKSKNIEIVHADWEEEDNNA